MDRIKTAYNLAWEFSFILLIPALIQLYLTVAPYTKVEESFNLQATHDILTHGIQWHKFRTAGIQLKELYDHFKFPGAVPRSFVGALLLSGLSHECVELSGGKDAQGIARGFLGFANGYLLVRYSWALSAAYGPGVGTWYTLFQAAQFHVLFYASRTLPNTFAQIFTTLAATALVTAHSGQQQQQDAWWSRWATWLTPTRLSIFYLVFAGVVFRAEIALLLGVQVLFLLATRRADFIDVAITGVSSAVLSLAVSVAVDSFYWQRLIWPEFDSFVFNVVHGSSSEWGVSPWHTYFSSSIPKMLLNPLAIPLIALALYLPATSYGARALIIPQLAFVALYSLQPHKEARFIIYTIPPLTGAAALGASYIWTRRSRTLLYRLGSLALVGSLAASFAASLGMVAVSALNYPGGEALWAAHQYVARNPRSGYGEVRLHMDVLSCMTGVSRFQQDYPTPPIWRAGSALPEVKGVHWWYDKTEDEELLLNPKFWGYFDLALMEEPEKALGEWEVVDTVYGLAGVEVLRPGEKRVEGRDEFVWGGLKSALMVWGGEDGEALEEEEFIRTVGTYNLFREGVRRFFTRGWWVGPRMEPKIYVMERLDTVSAK